MRPPQPGQTVTCVCSSRRSLAGGREVVRAIHGLLLRTVHQDAAATRSIQAGFAAVEKKLTPSLASGLVGDCWAWQTPEISRFSRERTIDTATIGLTFDIIAVR